MDDIAGDLDYLNDIRDVQMFQRAPRRKFERLETFAYYDDAEYFDRFRFIKEEMRSDKFTLTPVMWSQCWTEIKTIRNAITKHSNMYIYIYIAMGKEPRFIKQESLVWSA